VGRTPWGGDHAGEAPFVVEVSAPGYAPWRQTVAPGADVTLDAPLQKKR